MKFEYKSEFLLDEELSQIRRSERVSSQGSAIRMYREKMTYR